MEGNSGRDRWTRDRDTEAIKTVVTENKPETKRLEEIIEKAKQSFFEVWYAY